MKKFICLLFVSALAVGSFAQKTINDPNAEKRNVTSFNSIEVSGGVDLYLSQGSAETVVVSASQAKYRDKIKVEVVNGALKIWYDYEMDGVNIKFGDNNGKKLKAYVSFKDINSLEGSGGSDIDVDGTIKVSQLRMRISGGSDFDGKVDVSGLNIGQSGGSDISISGKTNSLKITASGGSDFRGFELMSETAEVEASGGSDVTITVNKELNITASGGSDVHYKGNASVKQVKSGGGSVKKSGK